jgi:uncharacterized protein YdeI (BOF family)
MASRYRKLRLESMEARQLMAVLGAIGGLDAGTVSGFVAPPADEPPPPSSTVPQLNSLPGAAASLYLDFDGHFQAQGLPGIAGTSNRTSPAFSRDGDFTTFSASEQSEIRDIWAQVAEDYAPFNINVTTVEPEATQPFMRVVISDDADFRGTDKLGFAKLGSYADSSAPNVAYAFATVQGRSTTVDEIGLTVSHEAGHAFGLEHYAEDTGTFAYAPIMAEKVSEHQRTVWWVDGSQNDMEVIASQANGFGYRPDDYKSSLAEATSMTATNAGLYVRGVIGKNTDYDTFRFETGGGEVKILLDVASFAPNLDARFWLFDSTGALIHSADNPDRLYADLTVPLSAGTYFVMAGGTGISCDVGQYTLTVRETSGPQVVSSQFQTISSTLTGLLLTFNEPINASTFTAADVRINGGILGAGVVGVQQLSDRQFLVTMSAPANTGLTVAIGPDILDRFGNRMDQNKNGISGESSDVYSTTRFPSRLLGAYDTELTTSPTSPTKSKLSVLATDTYFGTY